MKFTLLGTGSASQVPVYNCACIACERAKQQSKYWRRPCSALIQTDRGQWLIDSGLTDLTERFPAGTLQGIFQTHYHADHAQGLLQLRWGVNISIPVYGPDDPNGFADIYKHSGILRFQPPFKPFETIGFAGFSITALPLQHSRPTFGYLISDAANRQRIAYLTDTCGLSDELMQFLRHKSLTHAVIDCSYPPLSHPKNHNDVGMALQIAKALRAEETVLTHIDHAVDTYVMKNPQVLPKGVVIAQDNTTFL